MKRTMRLLAWPGLLILVILAVIAVNIALLAFASQGDTPIQTQQEHVE